MPQFEKLASIDNCLNRLIIFSESFETKASIVSQANISCDMVDAKEFIFQHQYLFLFCSIYECLLAVFI